MKLKFTFNKFLGFVLLGCILLAIPLLCGRGINLTMGGRYYCIGWVGFSQLEFTTGVRYGPDGKEVDRELCLGPIVAVYGRVRAK